MAKQNVLTAKRRGIQVGDVLTMSAPVTKRIHMVTVMRLCADGQLLEVEANGKPYLTYANRVQSVRRDGVGELVYTRNAGWL